MTKSSNSITILFIFLFSILFSQYNAAPIFSIRYVNNHLLRYEFAPVSIKTHDIRLQDLTFLAKPTKEESIFETHLPTPWNFSLHGLSEAKVANVLGISAPTYDEELLPNPQIPCINAKTGQVFAYLTHNSTTCQFTLSVYNNKDFELKYRHDPENNLSYGSHHILCPLQPTAIPTSNNIAVTFLKGGENQTRTENFPLPVPLNGFQTPIIDFHSLSITPNDDEAVSTSIINIEFTTDTPGMHTIETINAPSFYPISFSTNHRPAFFCSSSNKKHFARIQYLNHKVYVFVPNNVTLTNNAIKCELTISNSHTNSQYVRIRRSSVRISFANVQVSRQFELNFVRANIGADITTLGSDVFQVDIASTQLSMSRTPLSTNSTIQFLFSDQINVRSLYLDGTTGDTSYRGYYGCTTRSTNDNILKSFPSTIIIDLNSNSISLHDLTTPHDNFQCSFIFNGTKAFNFGSGDKMASLITKVDGTPVASMHRPGIEEPLYLRSFISLSPIIANIGFRDSDPQVRYSFVWRIIDSYRFNHITPSNPILLLSLRGDLHFTYEQYSSQLSCLASSPTDTTLLPLKLEFDYERLIWTVPLPDLIDVETFNISVQCSHNKTKITNHQFGLNITPRIQFIAQVIDLIDNKRYQHIQPPPCADDQDIPLCDLSSIRIYDDREHLHQYQFVQPNTQPQGITLPYNAKTHLVFNAKLQAPKTRSYFHHPHNNNNDKKHTKDDYKDFNFQLVFRNDLKTTAETFSTMVEEAYHNIPEVSEFKLLKTGLTPLYNDPILPYTDESTGFPSSLTVDLMSAKALDIFTYGMRKSKKKKESKSTSDTSLYNSWTPLLLSIPHSIFPNTVSIKPTNEMTSISKLQIPVQVIFVVEDSAEFPITSILNQTIINRLLFYSNLERKFETNHTFPVSFAQYEITSPPLTIPNINSTTIPIDNNSTLVHNNTTDTNPITTTNTTTSTIPTNTTSSDKPVNNTTLPSQPPSTTTPINKPTTTTPTKPKPPPTTTQPNRNRTPSQPSNPTRSPVYYSSPTWGPQPQPTYSYRTFQTLSEPLHPIDICPNCTNTLFQIDQKTPAIDTNNNNTIYNTQIIPNNSTLPINSTQTIPHNSTNSTNHSNQTVTDIPSQSTPLSPQLTHILPNGTIELPTLTTYIANPVQECGYQSGLQLLADLPIDSRYNWDAYVKLNYSSFKFNLCNIGEPCLTSIDCRGSSNHVSLDHHDLGDGTIQRNFNPVVCSYGICTVLPKREAKFVNFRSSNTQFGDKYLFNNAYTISTYFILFFSTILCILFFFK